MMKDWRSNVIRQVAVDTEAAADQFVKVNREDIAGNNLEVWPVARMRANFLPQIFGQTRVRFNGYHSTPVCGQHLRHLTVTRADLDPGFVRTGSKNL